LERRERILGYESAEIIGQLGSCISPKEDLERVRIRRNGRRRLKVRALARPWMARFWASGVVALRDEAGTLRGFAKVMRDFTERQRVS